MSFFTYKDIYIEEGKKVLEVNILPEKYCNFDCIFCPLGRTENKIDTQKSFNDNENSIIELNKVIENTKPDLIFINSKGEALVNDKIEDIVDYIKSKGLYIRLLSNGYLLSKDNYIKIASKCDEVIGEIKVTSQEHFQKVQRPINGYTLDEYILNMANFNNQFKGKFILEVTIIKGYNDDDISINKIKDMIKKISPDKLVVRRMDDEIFKKKLGISDERFDEISTELLSII